MNPESKRVNISENKPSTEVINDFGLSGKPVHLSGGQGECYRVGDYVLKPYKNIEECEFISDVYDQFRSEKIRMPKPLRANDGSWLSDGWGAISFLEGNGDAKVPMSELVEICKLFHAEVSSLSKSDHFEKRDDVWSVADRVCWGEEVIPNHKLTNKVLKKVFSKLETNTEPSQLIHGDFGPGNVLIHDTLPPAVIDLSPYWRPANFSIAVMIVDEIAYKGADESILELGKNISNFNQLLLRAATRRMCEFIGHERHPENDTDRNPDIIIYLNILKMLLKKYYS